MSALLRIADSTPTSGHVRDVPNPEVASPGQLPLLRFQRCGCYAKAVVHQCGFFSGTRLNLTNSLSKVAQY
jgi:hypothetical protein